jgi:predicted ABC-type ATPase
MGSSLDQRPIIIAIAGPNGAGKTTFFQVHLSGVALHFINADLLSSSLNLEIYAAAKLAGEIRLQFLASKESFAFETVFSDPVGEKILFLKNAAAIGYTVLLCFIGISGHEVASERVSMRVSKGGHDVPEDKLRARFPRTMKNLKTAIKVLPHVWIFDNDDLFQPYRKVAVYENGQKIFHAENLPAWFSDIKLT